jgi:hypothetical protein
MPTVQAFSDQFPIESVGPAAQSTVPVGVHGLNATVAASGNTLSNLIKSDGYKTIAVGVTSSQGGAINVQRYLDDAGLVKQGAAISATLAANTAQVCNVTDGNPFASYTVTITNTGGSTATLTNLAILQQA